MTDAAKIAADLRRLLPNAHAPYSGVHVAAAVESADGRITYGVNVENGAYPLDAYQLVFAAQGLCVLGACAVYATVRR